MHLISCWRTLLPAFLALLCPMADAGSVSAQLDPGIHHRVWGRCSEID